MSDVIKQGTTIFTGKPFVFVLNSEYRTVRCDDCLKSGKLLKCSGCRYVYYCNRNCQKKSWPIHKVECARIKKISPIELPDTVRIMARVIIKLNQGGADEVDYYTEKNFRKYKDLMSHCSDIEADAKRMRHFIMSCATLFYFLGETLIPDMTVLMDIYGKICINSCYIRDHNMRDIGTGLYLGPSVIDHSCKPNVFTIFEGTTIIVRTLTDLPSLDWSQIRISYIDLLDSNKVRREELHNLYYFWCDCERCKKEELMAEAAICPNSSCNSPCLIEADKCEKCNTKISVEFKKTFQEVVDFTARHLKEMATTACLDERCKIIISMVCLEKQKGVMHKFNVQHICTLYRIYDAAVKLKYWQDAEFYSKELVPAFLLYYGEINPMTGLMYLSMGKIQLIYLKKSKEALETLNKAIAILMITHGDQHSLMTEIAKPLLHLAMELSNDNHEV